MHYVSMTFSVHTHASLHACKHTCSMFVVHGNCMRTCAEDLIKFGTTVSTSESTLGKHPQHKHTHLCCSVSVHSVHSCLVMSTDSLSLSLAHVQSEGYYSYVNSSVRQLLACVVVGADCSGRQSTFYDGKLYCVFLN